MNREYDYVRSDYVERHRIKRDENYNPHVHNIDLSTKFAIPVYDQGKLGSCTGNGLAFLVQYLQHHLGESKENLGIPSRLFIYYDERYVEGSVDTDSGASIIDGVKTLHKYGVCFEVTWPYHIQNFAQQPSPDAYREAFNHMTVGYTGVVQSLQAIVGCLLEGYPITFGFVVYESFESQETRETGIVRMPNTKTEKHLGGHCVDIVGYDQKKGFLVRNSWGTSWGLKDGIEAHAGHCWFPVDYIMSLELCSEFYIITGITNLQ